MNRFRSCLLSHLRQFRAIFWIWCLCVTGYGIWLAWLNSSLPLADPSIAEWTKPAGVALLLIESLMLLYLFSAGRGCDGRTTDTQDGWEAALSRIVLALFFYVAMPLLAWWLVLTVTGNRGDLNNGRVTWMERLWYAQALLVSVCLFAGSTARAGWGPAVRLLTAVAAIAVAYAVKGKLAGEDPGPLGAWQTLSPVLWLVAGLSVYLLWHARLVRGRAGHAAAFVLPVILFAGGGLLPLRSGEMPSWAVERELPAALRANLKIGEPLLLTGHGQRPGYGIRTDQVTEQFCGHFITLHLEGLPEDCRASGYWQSLALLMPDGRRIEAAPLAKRQGHTSVSRPVGWSGAHRFITTAGADFHERDLAGTGLMKCRMEGVLRVRVEQRREKRLPLSPRQDMPLDGWFIEPSAIRTTASVADTRGTESERAIRMRQASTDGTLSEWDFNTGWYETLGFADVQVSGLEFVLPHQSEEDWAPERMDKLFPVLTGQESESEFYPVLKHAAALHRYARASDMDQSEPGSRRLSELVDRMGPAALDAMLKLLKEEFISDDAAEKGIGALGFVKDRVAKLLTPADLERIKEDAILMHFLKADLTARGLIAREDGSVRSN